MSKLQQGEGAAIQIIISPADSKWSADGKGFIHNIETRNNDPKAPSKVPVDQNLVQAVEKKISKVGFNTVIRLVASSPNPSEAKEFFQI